jgi:ABC-type glutathione transport system ATPase component
MNRGPKAALKLKRHNKITIYRDFLASFLNDLPYILTIASIIVISKLKGHGLASIIIWMGIVDYLVQASDSLKSFRDQGIEKKAILAQLEEQLSWVSKNENKCLKIKDVKKNKKLSSPKETFNLKDNGQITLSLNKGLWKIDGHNGSGKTTLWNTLIGYNVDYDTWSLKKVSLIQKELEGKVRIIEKSPGIVKEWSTFESQIMGFSSPENQSNFWMTLEKKLDHILPSKIGEEWLLIFKNLERLWKTRKNNEFSNGEQILFSLARVLYYFNKEVKVIISDECDSFLDKKTRKLYLETIRHFSTNISVWFISHTLGSKLEESV